MKFSAIFSTVALASVAAAQYELPSCAKDCIDETIANICDSATDYKCACSPASVKELQKIYSGEAQSKTCQSAAENCSTGDLKDLFTTVQNICQNPSAAAAANDGNVMGMMHPMLGVCAGLGALAAPFILA